MEQILRTQTQAYYAPANHGHFGLALGSYAHFTSPDPPLCRPARPPLAGRAALTGLGEGGLHAISEAEAMEVTGELISQLERRAMEAERDTIDRYVAAYLADRVGELVDCRITGVQPFGFFATVEGLGGDGLVPVSTLGARIFPLRRSEPDAGRRGERRELRAASGSSCAWSRPTRSPAACASSLPDAPQRSGRATAAADGTAKRRPCRAAAAAPRISGTSGGDRR